MKVLVAFYFAVIAVAQAINLDGLGINRREILPADGSRIVGGTPVSPGQFPFAVGVIVTKSTGILFCGGTILSQNWIISSASCVDSGISTEILVAPYGIYNGNQTHIKYQVMGIDKHPSWNSNTNLNNIAMLEVEKPITLSDEVAPIRLPMSTEIDKSYTNEVVTIVGFGKTSDTDIGISYKAHWAEQKIISNLACGIYYLGLIRDTQICLSGAGGQAPCGGDFGGPMVRKGSDEKYFLLGVASHAGSSTCSSGLPVVYTRITKFVNWISKTMDSSS